MGDIFNLVLLYPILIFLHKNNNNYNKYHLHKVISSATNLFNVWTRLERKKRSFYIVFIVCWEN